MHVVSSVVSVALAGSLAFSAPAPAAPVSNLLEDALGVYSSQSLSWGACEDDGSNTMMPGTECARLRAPVDWSAPRGETVELQAYRLKASSDQDGQSSRGTIANFPSGPGAPGYMGFNLELSGYDWIGLDPRGVGQSGALTCSATGMLGIPRVPPTDQAVFEQFRSSQENDFWPSCTTEPASLKNHMDAYSNANDMELLRRVLKLGNINLRGSSYGTLLAERYLGLFGEHVNGSILDGVMNPAQTRTEFLTTAAASSEAAYERFYQWCQSDTACVLKGRDIPEVFEQARTNVRNGEIPGTFMGVPWTEPLVTAYAELAIGAEGFAQAAQGLKNLAEGKNPEQDEMPAPSPMPEKMPYADPIVCSSFPLGVPHAQAVREDLASARAVASVMRYNTNSTQYSSICVGGPTPVPGSQDPVTSRSAHPTMLLSKAIDLATPKAWADAVAKQLGSQTIHLVADGIGHGAMRSPKIKEQVIDYLNVTNQPTPTPEPTPEPTPKPDTDTSSRDGSGVSEPTLDPQASSATGQPLARTGVTSLPWLLGASMLIVTVGAVLLHMTRKPRNS
ncbi:alpha/beta fold hydrolase [Acaricomes phytoseiuli]|uniref:alpha/beta fold hydrolase n=1 Tax=Acaricomes phytoseiuli TaxID=291968 RepID=UPI0029CAA73F|nr:alpha/beta fold hydrolase [Acaricomes phytoseiuli]